MKRIIISIACIVAAMTAINAQSSVDQLHKAQKAVEKARRSTAPDARQAVFEVKAYTDGEGRLTVGGIVSEKSSRDALITALEALGIDYADSIRLYPSDRWAMTRIPAASHRTAGRHSAEMATQSVLGTPLRLLEKGKEWWRVQTPDGYIAYIPSSSAVEMSDEQMVKWRKSRRFIVTSPYQVRVYRNADSEGLREVVSDLVNGSIVVASGGFPSVVNEKLNIELPDGRTGYVETKFLTPIEEWAAQDFNADKILDMAYSMEGTPYLWGGMSTKALDCSGLAKVSYYANGIILMRDASQQAKTGTKINAADWRTCRAGDLLFFGNASTGKVTHVAIYDHSGNYVHSSGRVKRNSVDPESESYLTTPFLHAVRIAGNEETDGIIRARNHPWYFDKE